jgi:hypothetical protein
LFHKIVARGGVTTLADTWDGREREARLRASDQ